MVLSPKYVVGYLTAPIKLSFCETNKSQLCYCDGGRVIKMTATATASLQLSIAYYKEGIADDAIQASNTKWIESKNGNIYFKAT